MVLFKTRVTSDVDDGCASTHESGRDEKTSVAARRILLGAEDHCLSIRGERGELCDPVREVDRPRAKIVVDGPIVPVEFASLWAPSELAPQEDVVDPSGSEPLL